MDTQFRTGEGLICEYTGRESRALVRMKSNDDADEASWTGWVSRDALNEALRLLSAVDPQSQPAPQPRAVVAAPQQPAYSEAELLAAPQPPPPRQPKPAARPVIESPQVVAQFKGEVSKLQREADKEEPEKGKHKGIRENDLKELIWKWRRLFQQPKVTMFKIMNEVTGIPQDRFEMLLKTQPTASERGGDDPED